MNRKPVLSVFGLGRMGSQIVRRLHKRGFTVYTWNRSSGPIANIKRSGIYGSNDIAEVIKKNIGKQPRIFWIMLPHTVVDDFIFGPDYLGKYLKRGDIVIDGGNSFYEDSIRRAAKLQKRGIYFFDSGTSGGVWGEKNGFALMIGGAKEKWSIVEPIFKALSAGDNYAYLGKAGAGHFAKMVHNGIEYGMMEAIGEGYAVLHSSPFKFNLEDVTRVYQRGSVIRSWLIDLCRDIFKHENVTHSLGKVDATGEAEWTVKTAKQLGVDVRVIEDALNVRRESVDPKNQNKFSNKIVALLRKQFGGHAIYTQTSKRNTGKKK